MTLSLLEVVRMFIGILLVITWLILLVRYPAKALPVSVAAVIGLGLVGAAILCEVFAAGLRCLQCLERALHRLRA